MPTYEYRCAQCGNLIEVYQRIDEEPLRTCERCGGELKKVFHPAGIVFKGSGFYATDSRRSSKPAESSKDGGKKDSTSSDKKDAKKDSKDTKPAGSDAS